MKIVICGGHLTPALALVEVLEDTKDLEILFFGRKFATEGYKILSAEYQTISQKKIKFFPITTGRLQRKFTKYTILSLLKLPLGFTQSFFYLVKTRPNLIVSFGSYLSVPIVFCGWLLGIKSLTHEQTVHSGLATRLNSLFAEKIFLSWPQTEKFLPKEKCQLIGNLIRKSIFKRQAKVPQIRRFLEKADHLIFVTGGNQGSHALNKMIFSLLDSVKKFQILHQVGRTNFEGDLDKTKKIQRTNYLVQDYIDSDDIGEVLNKAEVIICRSGANTIWELAALAKKSILVPLPIAGSNEQKINAQILENAGSAIIINQSDLTPDKVLMALDKILVSSSYQQAALRFAKTIPLDASRKLAKYILKNN